MLSTTTRFRQLAAGYIRPINWQLRASFDKSFEGATDFFTLDTSILDGPDRLASPESNVIAEWDKYYYSDFSERVISIEVNHEETEPYSTVQSYADVVLNNYDDYFTPNSGSPIDDYILPKRPFRIFMGFGHDVVPKFVGLSEKMPEISKKDKTAKFHLIDFLSYIFENSLPNDLLLENKTTDEILDQIFTDLGLVTGQYVLDVSSNVVPYFYASAGDNVGNKIKDLMQAELGKLYMDEVGIIRFKTLDNISDTSVYTFNKTNTIDYSVSGEDNIINKVKINMEILAETELKSVGISTGVVQLTVAQTKDVFINTNNPITSANNPTYQTSPISDSYYTASTDLLGATPYSDIDLLSATVFQNAVKLTFKNNGASTGYLQTIDIWGTPIEVVRSATIEDSDATSINDFDEKTYEFTTQYIGDDNDAETRAALIINTFKDYGAIVDLDVKGTMALQVGDRINILLDGYQGEYIISKVVDIMSGGQYQQRLRAKLVLATSPFILDTSVLDGTDYLGI